VKRLGYCLNVHPGETLEQVLAALRGPVKRARELAREPIGVGLYLAKPAVGEVLGSRAALDRLRGHVNEAGVSVFTANAFPFGGFHAERVKADVYRPTWSTPARLGYTVQVAHALAALVPEGGRASLSTAPVSYRAFPAPEPDLARAGEHVAIAAVALEKISRKKSRDLALAIEPEPLCVIERAAELVAFLREHVFAGAGRERIARELRVSRERAEAIARARIGACLDTAHHAVVFEPLEEALAIYARAGVRVVKAQLSSALEVTPANAASAARLRSFAEPRYLHQTFSSEGSHVEDIPDAFSGEALRPELARAELVRSHCHVPLAWAGDATLGTTRPLLESALPAIARATDDLEVETYTWSVLPESTRAAFGDDVSAMVAAELAWVRGRLTKTSDTR
jgi:sugar phosphate isomerase/epimerase